MFLQERQWFLLGRVAVDQGANRPQAIGAIGQSNAAGAVDAGGPVMPRQRQEPLQDAHPLDAALGEHGLGPGARLAAQRADAAQKPICATFHAGDLLRSDVLRVGAEATRLLPHMRPDLLQPIVEDPHDAAVPAHPDRTPQVLRWHRVVGLGHLDVAIAMHLAPRFVEERKTLGRQGSQRRTFHFQKQLADLLANGAVHARVGNRLFPRS